MQFTVYSKPDCQPCKLTKLHLDERGLDYEELDARDHVDFLTELGFRASPVVLAVGDDGETQSWSGFCPELIDEVVARHQAREVVAHAEDGDVVYDKHGLAWQASVFPDDERVWYSAMGIELSIRDEELINRARLFPTKQGSTIKTEKARAGVVDYLDQFEQGNVVIDAHGDAWQYGVGQFGPYWYRCYGGAYPNSSHDIANLAPFTPLYFDNGEEIVNA